MVASLVLTGKFDIGVNTKGKVKVDGHLISVDDIPFIRYRFPNYGPEEFEFIKKNMAKFSRPVHLAEITIGNDTADVLTTFEEIGKIATFVYIPVTDDNIANGLGDNVHQYLEDISECYFDRIMIKDNTSMMYPLAAEKIKLEISEYCDFKSSDIGICGSSLSFRCGDEPGQACLTAVWARTIMANYASADDIVVPTASHESMDCCGCIRYFVVSSDLPAPLSSKEKSEASKDGKADKPKEHKVSKPKIKVAWDSDI